MGSVCRVDRWKSFGCLTRRPTRATKTRRSLIRLVCFRLMGHKGPLQPRMVPERDLALTMPGGAAAPSSSEGEGMSEADALRLVGELEGLERVGEYAFIVRPVVYCGYRGIAGTSTALSVDLFPTFPSQPTALLLRTSASRGTLKSSWTPLLASLVLDLVSLSLYPRSSLTFLQQDELIRRLHLLLYYLLREPVFSGWTAPALGRFFGYAARRPVVNLTTFVLMEYVGYWRRLYFYSSASS